MPKQNHPVEKQGQEPSRENHQPKKVDINDKPKRHLPALPRPRLPRPNFHHIPFRRSAIKEVVKETTSGGIVFRRRNSGVEILLIKDAKNRWTIPKGHVEPGEEIGATAEREIREETGLAEMEVYSELGKVNFRYRRLDTLVLMTMHIWLVEARGDSDKLDPEEYYAAGTKWFPALTAVDKIAYDDIGKLILLAMKKIRKGTF